MICSLAAYRPLYIEWSNMVLLAVSEAAAVFSVGGMTFCALSASKKKRSVKNLAVCTVVSMLVFFLLLFGITYLFNVVLKTGSKTEMYSDNLFAVNIAYVALFLYASVWIGVFFRGIFPKAAAMCTAAAVIATCAFGAVSLGKAVPTQFFYPVYRTFVSFGGTETSDPDIRFGFQYSTVKVQPTDNLTDMRDFTVRLAKNEREGCQLTVAAGKNAEIGVSVGTLTDADGHIMPTSIYSESYLHIRYGRTAFSDEFPDALVPCDENTTVTVPKNKNRTFYIETVSDSDSHAGKYTAPVRIYSGGQLIAESVLTAEVWDFSLPQQSACSTAVGLSGEIFELAAGLENNRYGVNTWLTFYDGSIELTDEQRDVYKSYYDCLKEHKLCPNYLPYDISDERADAYMDDPQVTSFCIPYSEDDTKLKAYWEKINSKAEWVSKAYFYPVDEPHNKDGRVESFITRTKRLSELCPGYHMVCPFDAKMITKPDGETVPVYKFEEGWADIICPVIHISSVFKDFPDWLNDRRAQGDRTWWYVCCNPDDELGYCNLFTYQNAVKHRMMFWQQYAAGYEGFLYYETCNWGYRNDPWNDPVTLYGADDTREAGDGLLLYPGRQVGVAGPVGSVRLKCVTDGIEDFDYLTLASKYLGADAAQKYAEQLSASYTEYTTDVKLLNEVRTSLGEALAAAAVNSAELL